MDLYQVPSNYCPGVNKIGSAEGITFFIYLFRKKYIEDIQIFGMNMPFISSSEAKNAYFMSGEATNEIFIFSLPEMK